MADEYPRLLADRDVVVIRHGQPEQVRLRGWLDGHDGPIPTYRIELVTRLGSYTCPYTATGPDMFEALVRLRRQLEPDGLMVAVQGSRRDTYPSGMARDMGGGMQVYIMRPGLRGRRQDPIVQPGNHRPPLLGGSMLRGAGRRILVQALLDHVVVDLPPPLRLARQVP
jgi:hypothetical protein